MSSPFVSRVVIKFHGFVQFLLLRSSNIQLDALMMERIFFSWSSKEPNTFKQEGSVLLREISRA